MQPDLKDLAPLNLENQESQGLKCIEPPIFPKKKRELFHLIIKCCQFKIVQLLILTVIMVVTFNVMWLIKYNAKARNIELDNLSNKFSQTLSQKVDQIAFSLDSLSSLLLSVERPRSDQWRNYTSSLLELTKEIDGTAWYIQMLGRERQAGFMEEQRTDLSSYPDAYATFKIEPAPSEDLALVISHIEPFAGDHKNLGKELWHDEIWRKAFLGVIRTGSASLISVPTQNEHQKATSFDLAFVLPIYHKGATRQVGMVESFMVFKFNAQLLVQLVKQNLRIPPHNPVSARFVRAGKEENLYSENFINTTVSESQKEFAIADGLFVVNIGLPKENLITRLISLRGVFSLVLMGSAILFFNIIVLAHLIWHSIFYRKDGIHKSKLLNSRESQFKAIMEATTYGVFIAKTSGAIVHANMEFQRITNMNLSALQRQGWTSVVQDTLKSEIDESWKDVIAHQRLYSSEVPFVRDGGEIVWTETRITPIKNEEQVIGFIGSFYDITARKNEQANFTKMIDELSSERVTLQSTLNALEYTVSRMHEDRTSSTTESESLNSNFSTSSVSGKDTDVKLLKEFVMDDQDLMDALRQARHEQRQDKTKIIRNKRAKLRSNKRIKNRRRIDKSRRKERGGFLSKLKALFLESDRD